MEQRLQHLAIVGGLDAKATAVQRVPGDGMGEEPKSARRHRAQLLAAPDRGRYQDQAIGRRRVLVHHGAHHHRAPHALAQQIKGQIGRAQAQKPGRRLQIRHHAPVAGP